LTAEDHCDDGLPPSLPCPKRRPDVAPTREREEPRRMGPDRMGQAGLDGVIITGKRLC
jgi:hypothetical protein